MRPDIAGNMGAFGAALLARERYQEAVARERMVTAVLCVSGCLEPVSVKTQRPVPKAAMKDVLAAVAALRLDAPVAAGDVLIEDVCGTGVAVVATKSVC